MEGGRLEENIRMKEEHINKVCSLSMEAHISPRNPYLHERSQDSSVFSFAGSWAVEGWFNHKPFGKTKINLDLFRSLKSIGNDEAADVNEASLGRFEAILGTSSFANEVKEAVMEKKQIVFSGHSSGGPMAILATLWFLEEYLRPNSSQTATPLCVTFGSPLVGDRIFPHSLRRENWDSCFIHFVMRYDIVPRIMLAPLSSMEQELQPILHFFNPNSVYFKEESIARGREASTFFMTVMRNVSLVASHAACNLTGCTNSLLDTITSFIELSPYRPFGTYIFCTGNGKLVLIKNPDAVLQLLFYSSQMIFQCFLCLQMVARMSTRARLSLRAAGELQMQKLRNQDKVVKQKNEIEVKLKSIQAYQSKCKREAPKVGYYDAFKLQNNVEDFNANVERLHLAGIWDGIIEMLKRYQLPDEFEGSEEWIKLGTEYRRLVEPLDIANYYRHSKNDETKDYLEKGARPKRYRYTQRWREHAERIGEGSSSESFFWAAVERLIIDNKPFEQMQEKILRIERDVLEWFRRGEIGDDVFLVESTFSKWWKTLPHQHRRESCLAAARLIGN